MLGILNDILDLTKVEANKLELARTPFNLKKELGILAAVVLPEAEGKGLEFSLEIAPDVPLLLMGDALRVRQVLLNLCNNAVKFTDEGSVSLRVRVVDSTNTRVRLEFVVRDCGIGIPESEIGRIFSRSCRWTNPPPAFRAARGSGLPSASGLWNSWAAR